MSTTKKATQKKHKKQTDKHAKLKKGLSTIIVTLLVPVFLSLLFFSTLEATLFNADYYKQSFVEADTYNRLVSDGVPSIILKTENQNDDFFDFIIRKSTIYVFQKLVTPEWLQNETEVLVDDAMVYMSTPGDSTKIINFLDTFRDEYVVNASSTLAMLENSLPTCEENLIIAFFPEVDCSEVNKSIDEVRAELKASRADVEEMETQLVTLTNDVERYVKIFYALRTFIHDVPMYKWGSLGIMTFLLLLLCLIRFRNVASLLKWASVPFMIASLLMLFVNFIARRIADIYFNSLVLSTTFEMEQIIRDLILTISNNFFHYVFSFSLVTLIISALLLTSAYVIEHVDWRKTKQSAHKLLKKVKATFGK